MKRCPSSVQPLFGRIAVGLSGACAVHCLLTPVVLIAIPTFGSILSDEQFHVATLVLVLPISGYALFRGCRKHRSPAVVLPGSLGLCILVVSALFGHWLFGESGERIVTILGSSLVAISHFLNMARCANHSVKIGGPS
jgi:MerC mercury resistance protein